MTTKKEPTELEPLAQEAKKYKSAEEFVDNQLPDILKNKQFDYEDAIKEYNVRLDKTRKQVGDLVSKGISFSNFGVQFTNIKSGEIFINEFPSRTMAEQATARFKETLGKKIRDIEFLDKEGVFEFNRKGMLSRLAEERPQPEDFGFYNKQQLTDIYNQAIYLPLLK